MNKTSDYPEEHVRDSWEELADEMTITQPVIKKAAKKTPKKSDEKLIPQVESPRQDATAAVSSTAKLSSSPEIGKVKILKRDPGMQARAGPEKKTAGAAIPVKTYEERVAAYNEARMRIFGSLDDEISINSSNPPEIATNMLDSTNLSLNANISKNAQPSSNLSSFNMHR